MTSALFHHANSQSMNRFRNDSAYSSPCSSTHSKPCFPIPALAANRSTLAFSIRRATRRVGNWDTRSACWWNKVDAASAPVTPGLSLLGLYVMSSRHELGVC